MPGSLSPSLLTGGAFHWWVPPDGHGLDLDSVGWDTAAGFDLDLAAWVLAWAGDTGGPVFQDLVATAAAVCPACERVVQEQAIYVDTLLGGGAMDYKYATLYGEILTQLPAERPCEFHMMGSSPVDLETWVDLDALDPPQAWMIAHTQNPVTKKVTVVDNELSRAILFSESSPLGDSWCWDGVGKGNTAGFTTDGYLSAGTSWDLVCQDSDMVETGLHGFPACDTSGDPFAMERANVGSPARWRCSAPTRPSCWPWPRAQARTPHRRIPRRRASGW